MVESSSVTVTWRGKEKDLGRSTTKPTRMLNKTEIFTGSGVGIYGVKITWCCLKQEKPLDMDIFVEQLSLAPVTLYIVPELTSHHPHPSPSPSPWPHYTE